MERDSVIILLLVVVAFLCLALSHLYSEVHDLQDARNHKIVSPLTYSLQDAIDSLRLLPPSQYQREWHT